MGYDLPPAKLPLLRAGKPYDSLDVVELYDARDGQTVVAEVSQANPGIIAHDLNRAADNRRALGRLDAAELIEICKRAAELFMTAELPLGDDQLQTPVAYVRQLSATTGIPERLVRANMDKNRLVLAEMDEVLGGLTRSLDLAALDRGYVEQDGRRLAYRAETDVLGAVLPSNSPGVHGLWLPAIPLKVPLALKAGRQEPWTPWRLAQALIAAGCPPEGLSLYPSSHDGATTLLLRAGRSLLFGDGPTVDPWRHDHRVSIHGPGFSKVVIGADRIDEFADDLETMTTSIALNGGRSCLNASGVWVPSRSREIAEALGERLAKVEARRLDDPAAELAAFPSVAGAHATSKWLDEQLAATPGAEDITARYRDGDRVVLLDGCAFLLPTVVWCDSPDHPLAQAELLFPFAAVVESDPKEVLDAIGPTLVGTVLSDDQPFRDRALRCRNIDRLNLGPIPTTRISWDQPHEGNLFQHLYRQRSLQL